MAAIRFNFKRDQTSTVSPIETSNSKIQRKDESFEEFKIRRFKENYEILYNLMQRNKEKFVEINLKKQGDLLVTLWKGGIKLATLSNNDILFHVEGELIDFIKSHL